MFYRAGSALELGISFEKENERLMQEAAADAADTAAITLSTYGTYRRKPGAFDSSSKGGRFLAGSAMKPLRQQHRASSEQYTSSLGGASDDPFFTNQYGTAPGTNQYCTTARRNRLVFFAHSYKVLLD